MRRASVRFTIRRMMAVVALVAFVLWLLQHPDGLPFAIGVCALVAAFGCGLSVRGRRREAAIGFIASTMTATAAVIPFCVYLQGWALIVAFIGMVFGLPLTLGFGTAWAMAAIRGNLAGGPSPWSRWHPLPALLLVVAMTASPPMTIWTFWPLRAAFLISRPALERLADRVAAGQNPAFPTWAGVYRIVGSRYVNGWVALIFDPNPSGPSAFVRYPPGENVPRRTAILFISLKLTPRWTFEIED
jgi:hypothetical protein